MTTEQPTYADTRRWQVAANAWYRTAKWAIAHETRIIIASNEEIWITMTVPLKDWNEQAVSVIVQRMANMLSEWERG